MRCARSNAADVSELKYRASQMLARLYCWVFGHRMEVWQHFSHYSRRVICERCGGDWAMNDEVRAIVPWSGEFAQMYEMFGHPIRKRPAPQHDGEPK